MGYLGTAILQRNNGNPAQSQLPTCDVMPNCLKEIGQGKYFRAI